MTKLKVKVKVALLTGQFSVHLEEKEVYKSVLISFKHKLKSENVLYEN